jgi:hypothetical protein
MMLTPRVFAACVAVTVAWVLANAVHPTAGIITALFGAVYVAVVAWRNTADLLAATPDVGPSDDGGGRDDDPPAAPTGPTEGRELVDPPLYLTDLLDLWQQAPPLPEPAADVPSARNDGDPR